MKTELNYQLSTYSFMRGEWVVLAMFDTHEQAEAGMQTRGDGNYKIDKIYKVSSL